MKKSFILATILCSSASFAGDFYMGGGIHRGMLDVDGLSSVTPMAIKLETGKYLSDHVALEGHLAFGVGKSSISYPYGGDIDFSVKNAVSIFLKGDLDINENANLYGLAGFTKGKFEMETVYYSETDSDSGFSYGVGVETKLENDFVISAEYVMYLKEDDYDYSGINLSFTKLF
jgi:outer membrane immunogenic protein